MGRGGGNDGENPARALARALTAAAAAAAAASLLLLLPLQPLCIWAAPMRAWRSQLAPTDGSRGRCSLYAIPPTPPPPPCLLPSLSHLKIFKTLHINICALHKSHPLFIDCKMLNAAAGLLHTHTRTHRHTPGSLFLSLSLSTAAAIVPRAFFFLSPWHFFSWWCL